jgi:NADH dehydrogenase [ubiquinone] 1 alpha subcomplex assembly factor 6
MGPAVSTQLWLDRLQKVDFDIFHGSLRQMEWKLPFIAWLRNRRGQL